MTIKLIEFRKLIKTYLLTKVDRVYFEQAPNNAVYPYIVVDLPNSVDDGSMENFVMDVDGWDAPPKGNTTALETMMNSVDGDGLINNPSGLHRKTLTLDGELSITFYRENRLTLRDDVSRIRRRKIIYQARTHVPNT